MPDIILLIILYPFLFILHHFLRCTVYEQKETCFHMIIPKWLWKDTRLQQILITYQRRVRRNIIISAIMSLVVILTPSPSVSITLLYLWLLFTITVAFLPYGQANLEVRHLFVQLKYAKEEVPIPDINPTNTIWSSCYIKITIAIKIFLGLYPILYVLYHLPSGKNVPSIMLLIFALNILNLLILYIGYKVEHMRPYPICIDKDMNETLLKIQKRHWRICFAILMDTNIISIYVIFIFFQYLLDHHLLFLLSTYLFLFLCHCLFARCTKIIIRKQRHLMSTVNIEPAYSLENNNWIWGLFYYNPSDHRVFVRSNFISSISINYARKLGRILHYIGSFFLISGLFICIWTCFLEFTPLSLSMEDNQIIATQLRDEYFIPIEELEDVKLLEELPIQLVQSSFVFVSKGIFKVDGYGNCTLFVHPSNTYYIYLRTTNQKQYILSSSDDEETLSFYDQILNLK